MWNNEKRYPVNGTFELTGRCNLSCRMCLVRVSQNVIRESGMRERTAEEWIHMAEQVRDAGTLGLLLTGGEVMLRPDFGEIYEAVSRMGFILTLYTNATMVTDKIVRILKESPPHTIGVTMYGASNETYQKMCGCADGYDRFVEGVRRLRELSSLFEVRTTIIRDNLADLAAMKAFVAGELGTDKKLTVSRMVAEKVRGGVAEPKKCRLTPEENVELVRSDVVELWRQVQSGDVRLPDAADKLRLQERPKMIRGGYLFEHCRAGLDSYIINWSGRMYACGLLDQGYTEPFLTGFGEAWERLPEQYPASRVIEKCSSCKLSGLCEVCPAVRLSETGDWFGVPEYSCREAGRLYEILSDLKIVESK